MLYKRGDVWWFKFRFAGQEIRESAHTSSKTLARDAERKRRRDLEEQINGLSRKTRPKLFRVAAQAWLDGLTKPNERTRCSYRDFVRSLNTEFGNRLVTDLDANDVSSLQAKRQGQGYSARTINYEVGTLRQILKKAECWARISDEVKMLTEHKDIGRALSREDEEKLLEKVKRSPSPSLWPAFVLSIDTGLRASELRSLRRRDLEISWREGVIVDGSLRVSRSKTAGGTGRIVPLSARVRDVLSLWLSRFPEADGDAYVFPCHQVVAGMKEPSVRAVQLDRPMTEWKHAWETARTKAGLDYRWHDLRHTFVSRLAENPHVSEQTIMALAGHVSKRMLEHYSHTRTHAKRAAIAALDQAAKEAARAAESEAPKEQINYLTEEEGAQNWAQSPTVPPRVLS
jgi:integrase